MAGINNPSDDEGRAAFHQGGIQNRSQARATQPRTEKGRPRAQGLSAGVRTFNLSFRHEFHGFHVCTDPTQRGSQKRRHQRRARCRRQSVLPAQDPSQASAFNLLADR